MNKVKRCRLSYILINVLLPYIIIYYGCSAYNTTHSLYFEVSTLTDIGLYKKKFIDRVVDAHAVALKPVMGK